MVAADHDLPETTISSAQDDDDASSWTSEEIQRAAVCRGAPPRSNFSQNNSPKRKIPLTSSTPHSFVFQQIKTQNHMHQFESITQNVRLLKCPTRPHDGALRVLIRARRLRNPSDNVRILIREVVSATSLRHSTSKLMLSGPLGRIHHNR